MAETFKGNLQGTPSRPLEMLTSSKAVTASHALSSERLGWETKGSDSQSIFISGGVPVAISKSIGSKSQSVYLNAGKFTAGDLIPTAKTGSWDTSSNWITANSAALEALTGSSGEITAEVAALIAKSESWNNSSNWVGSNSASISASVNKKYKNLILQTGSFVASNYNPTASNNTTVNIPTTASHIGAVDKGEFNNFTSSVADTYLPKAGGEVTGNLTVDGNFEVKGTASYINTEQLNVKDKLILVASGSTTQTAANGAGIAVQTGSNGESSAARIQYVSAQNVFTASVGFKSDKGFTGSLLGTASWAVSASEAAHALSSSYAVSSAYASSSTSASRATEANHAVSASEALHAATATTAATASYVAGGVTVDSASEAIHAISASHAAEVKWDNVTNHPSFYSASFKTGSFTAKTYGPTSGSQTINIPTEIAHINGLSTISESVRQLNVNSASWKGMANTASAAYISASAALATASVAQREAESASAYKTQASASANSAAGWAISASASATNAATSATNAANSATRANASASVAHRYSLSASLSASNASASASAASQSAYLANLYTVSASASNTTIQQLAANTQEYANHASASASKAAGWATSASNSATVATNWAASASNAKDAANLASASAKQYATDASASASLFANPKGLYFAQNVGYKPNNVDTYVAITSSNGSVDVAGLTTERKTSGSTEYDLVTVYLDAPYVVQRETSASNYYPLLIAAAQYANMGSGMRGPSYYAANIEVNPNRKGIRVVEVSASNVTASAITTSKITASAGFRGNLTGTSSYALVAESIKDSGSIVNGKQDYFADVSEDNDGNVYLDLPSASLTLEKTSSSDDGYVTTSSLQLYQENITLGVDLSASGVLQSANTFTNGEAAGVQFSTVAKTPNLDLDSHAFVDATFARAEMGVDYRFGDVFKNTKLEVLAAENSPEPSGSIRAVVENTASLIVEPGGIRLGTDEGDSGGSGPLKSDYKPSTGYIKGVSYPINGNDGVPKQYVDDVVNNVKDEIVDHYGIWTKGSHSTKPGAVLGYSAQGNNEASGQRAIAAGYNATASGNYSVAIGVAVQALGETAHAEGFRTTASKGSAHAEGEGSFASGSNSHAEGTYTKASGNNSHAEGARTVASGLYAHAEGSASVASGTGSHAEGQKTTASGQYAHAEGELSKATTWYTHAEGCNTTASGYAAHAEGSKSCANGRNSHAEGHMTKTNGMFAHAEGIQTNASYSGSHAEGLLTSASADISHTEGNRTLTTGIWSHAEGYYSTASNSGSHAEGYQTIASNPFEHAQGRYNFTASNQIFSVGTGIGEGSRKNAISIITGSGTTPSASIYVYGVGSYDGTNPQPGVNDLATVISASGASEDWYTYHRTHDDDFTAYLVDVQPVEPNVYINIPSSTGSFNVNVFESRTGDIEDLGTGSSFCLGGDIILSNKVEGEEPAGTITLTGHTASIDADLIVEGDITVKGTASYIDTEHLNVKDTLVLLASGSTSKTAANGAGIAIQTASAATQTAAEKAAARFQYDGTIDVFTASVGIKSVKGFTGSLNGTASYAVSASYAPNSSNWLNGIGEGSVRLTTSTANGLYAVAQGSASVASGTASHAEGIQTIASETGSHAEGRGTIASGQWTHAEGGFTTASALGAHAEGMYTRATGWYSHAEGYGTNAVGSNAHAEGYYTSASGDHSHAEGEATKAEGRYSHTEGNRTSTLAYYAHAEGYNTTASSYAAHAEGYKTVAFGTCSHAEGSGSLASGLVSHVEGFLSTASAQAAHAEGFRTVASRPYAHAEGMYSEASNTGSHAEGSFTTASGRYAHAEGSGSVASETGSHAEGRGTIASNLYEHAVGQYNKSQARQIFSIGVGHNTASRKNAISVITSSITGSSTISASVFVYGVGSYDGTNPQPGVNDLATVINISSSWGVEASKSAASASAYAAIASGSMEDARFYSSQAATNATLASTYAVRASASADNAAASASSAAASKTSAAGYATAAGASASAAATSATNAANAATRAANSASVAQGWAASSSKYATNASASASLMFKNVGSTSVPVFMSASVGPVAVTKINLATITASTGFRGNLAGNVTGTASYATTAHAAQSMTITDWRANDSTRWPLVWAGSPQTGSAVNLFVTTGSIGIKGKSGHIVANAFSGSLRGTASYATNAKAADSASVLVATADVDRPILLGESGSNGSYHPLVANVDRISFNPSKSILTLESGSATQVRVASTLLPPGIGFSQGWSSGSNRYSILFGAGSGGSNRGIYQAGNASGSIGMTASGWLLSWGATTTASFMPGTAVSATKFIGTLQGSATSATTATRLLAASGSTRVPIYLSASGVPKACTGYTVTAAETASWIASGALAKTAIQPAATASWATASNMVDELYDVGQVTYAGALTAAATHSVVPGKFYISQCNRKNIRINLQSASLKTLQEANNSRFPGSVRHLRIWGGVLENVNTVTFVNDGNIPFKWSENTADIVAGNTYEYNFIQVISGSASSGSIILGIVSKFS